MAITKKLRIDMQDLEGELRKLQDELDALSSTELGFLDGAIAGGVVASKAVVADASGFVTEKRNVIADGAAVVLTAAQSGAVCVFDKTDGALFTLPAPAVGLTFEFQFAATLASGAWKVITNVGTVFILGSVLMDDGDTGLTTSSADFNGSTHVAVSVNGTTSGGVKGGFFRLTCLSATQWLIHSSHILHTGNVATPASTS